MLAHHRIHLLCVLALSTFLSGCTLIARRIAAELARLHVERTFNLVGGSATRFRACLTGSGGVCPGSAAAAPTAFTAGSARQPLTTDLSSLRAAALARPSQPSAGERVLTHPVQQRLNAFYNQLAGLSSTGANVAGLSAAPADGGGGNHLQMHFDVAEVDDYMRLVAEATQADDWNRLARSADLAAPASWDATLLAYVSTYVKAYFRGGRFLKLSDESRAKLEKALQARFPFLKEDQLKDVFPALLKGPVVFGAIGSDAFVTRTGASYQFPAIEARIDPATGHVSNGTNVDLPVVAADLTRVVLEAVFDAHDQLPAVTAATGTTIDAAHHPLKVHDPAKSPVDAEEFAEVTRHANQAEAAVSTAVAPVVRGAGWASLNNEALAKLIETLVSVTVRKVTEKAAWGYYACASPTDALTPVPSEGVDLTLVIDGN